MRTLAALTLVLLTGPPADARGRLVGTWISELAGAALTLELRADGTAAAMGETASWSVRGDRLVIGEETFRYQLAGERLLLTDAGGTTTGWQRSGGARAARAAQPAPPPGPAKAGGGAGSPVDAQLRQLLLSSAWCSFRYNQHTGTTNQSRAVFAPDGTVHLGTDDQTYNSGSAGTVTGQYRSGSNMRWAVQEGRLLVDSGEGRGFEDVGLKVTRNSAGNPILIADGKEYAACR